MRISGLIVAALLLFFSAFSACERQQESEDLSPKSERQAAEAPEVDPLVAWHQERSLPIESDEDLSPLVELAGHRRLILLGDNSQGTANYYDARADLTLAIAEEVGLDFVVLQIDVAAARPIDDYIMGEGDVDLDEILRQGFTQWPSWRWANQQFASFVERLREYNATHPDRAVRVYGLEVANPFGSIEALQKLTEVHHPTRLAELNRHLACLNRFAPEIEDYPRFVHDRGHGHSHHGHDDHDHDDHHSDHGDELGRCTADTEKAAQLTMELFTENDRAHLMARNHARAILGSDIHQMSRLFGKGSAYWNTQLAPAYAIVSEISKNYGEDSRGVVWAHNSYTGDARASRMQDQQRVNLGHQLREEFGENELLIVSFSGYQGEIFGTPRMRIEPEVQPMTAAQEGSVDEILYRLRPADQLIIFGDGDADLPFWKERPRHRELDAIYDPPRDHLTGYVPTNPAARYDAIVFFAQTRALSPLVTP